MTARLNLKRCRYEDLLGDYFCVEGKLFEQDEHGGAHVIGECPECAKATRPCYVAPDRCPTCGAMFRCGCDDQATGLPRKLLRNLLDKEKGVLG